MKSININKFLVVLFAGSVALSSCSDYLTTLPTDSLVSDGAITTPEDTKTALNGAYVGLISVSNDGESYYYYGTHFLNGNDLITVDWSDYRTVMPIPQAEIDANPNMKQNPEY